VICAGDFRQLTPVASKPGDTVWVTHTNLPVCPAEFTTTRGEYVKYQSPLIGTPTVIDGPTVQEPLHVVKVCALLENHRQKIDQNSEDDEQEKFIKLLHDIGAGNSSDRPLSKYEYKVAPNGDLLPLTRLNTHPVLTHEQSMKAVHIYSSNAACANHNENVRQLALAKNPTLRQKTYTAQVEVFPEYPGTRKEFESTVFDAVEPILNLYKGAKFMVRKNVEGTLFNNGTVGEILELSNEGIKLQVNNPDGSVYVDWLLVQPAIVPVDPITGNAYGSVLCLPGHLANAMVPHKVQGLSLDTVVAHLGYHAPDHGVMYTLVSRVHKGKNFYLIPHPNGKVHTTTDPTYKALIEESEMATTRELAGNPSDMTVNHTVQDFTVTITASNDTHQYQQTWYCGALMEATVTTGDISRSMDEYELKMMARLIQEKRLLTVVNIRALNEAALRPMLEWAKTRVHSCMDYISQKGDAVIPTINSMIKARSIYTQMAMTLLVNDDVGQEHMLEWLEGRTPKITIDFSKVDREVDLQHQLDQLLDTLGEQAEVTASAFESQEDFVANAIKLIKLSTKFHAEVLSSKNPELASLWDTQVEIEGVSLAANITKDVIVNQVAGSVEVAEVVAPVEIVEVSVKTEPTPEPTPEPTSKIVQDDSISSQKANLKLKIFNLAQELEIAKRELDALEVTEEDGFEIVIEKIHGKAISYMARLGVNPSEGVTKNLDKISASGAMVIIMLHGGVKEFQALTPDGSESSSRHLYVQQVKKGNLAELVATRKQLSVDEMLHMFKPYAKKVEDLLSTLA